MACMRQRPPDWGWKNVGGGGKTERAKRVSFSSPFSCSNSTAIGLFVSPFVNECTSGSTKPPTLTVGRATLLTPSSTKGPKSNPKYEFAVLFFLVGRRVLRRQEVSLFRQASPRAGEEVSITVPRPVGLGRKAPAPGSRLFPTTCMPFPSGRPPCRGGVLHRGFESPNAEQEFLHHTGSLYSPRKYYGP